MKTKMAKTKSTSVDHHALLAVGNFTIYDVKVVWDVYHKGGLCTVSHSEWGTERQILRTETNVVTNAHVLPQWPK